MAVQPEVIKPPRTEVGLLGWLKKNLFSTWYNALLTIFSIAFIYIVLRGVITWVVRDARWRVVTVNFRVFMIGRYPSQDAWRVWVSLGIVVLLAVLTWVFRRAEGKPRRWLVIGWLLSFPLIIVLLRGYEVVYLLARILAAVSSLSLGVITLWAVFIWVSQRAIDNRILQRRLGVAWLLPFSLIIVSLLGRLLGLLLEPMLPPVPVDMWSGVLLTLVLSIVGIVASFPLGVLLALGRRSKLPAIKVLCTVYIETIRGVPLISVLFMSQLMLPLFLPPEIRLGTVMRALTGMTLFSAAYTAENVRGGLAAIPMGQYEAARAVGLNEVLVMGLIVLPQALRTVIPAIVGQFISLFKDTTLVVIVGLLDLLGIAKAVTGQKEFIGLHKEVYAFAAVIFFICCYTMSHASRRLEQALGVGER